MDNKNVGKIIILLAILLGVLVFMLRGYYVDSHMQRVTNDSNGACEHTGEGCPHEEINRINPLIYFSITIIVGLILIGVYLMFPPKVKKRK